MSLLTKFIASFVFFVYPSSDTGFFYERFLCKDKKDKGAHK